MAAEVTLRHATAPTEPGRSVAPITAIARGSSMRAIARLSARCSRRLIESTNSARRGDREVDLDHAAVEPALQRPPGAGEHGEHRPVLAEHLGGEPLDPVRRGDGGEVLEQQRGDADAVMGVVDHERRVGVVATGPTFVTRPADDLAVRFDDEGGPVDEVDVGEVGQLPGTERRLRREVAAVAALVGLTGVELGEPRGVGRGDRTDRDRLAVTEYGVRRPRRRVLHDRAA